MATIKSFTSLEQSKKLAEILPLESADMHYNKQMPSTPICQESFLFPTMEIPCWSPAALLDILKYPSLTKNVENKWFIMDWTGTYPKSEYDFDSPVDACYEMIMHLYELNLL